MGNESMESGRESRRGPAEGRRADSVEPDERLLAAASRILEGEPVDWEALRSPALEPQLRLLDSLSQFNRAAQRVGLTEVEARTPERWGHLEIIERIGGGSFADVYHAWDPRLERDVALKLLRQERPSASAPDEGERAITEARLLAKVQHPNVVTVYGADVHDGRVGIWMELVHGETLWKLVRERGPLGAREVTAIGHELLAGLAAVHAAGVLHRDLKAQNVMRAEGGRILLMDFGLGQDRSSRRGEDPNLVYGTALYAAPERLRGGAATVSSELYSLGVLLYYLATAGFPVEAASFNELMSKHERGERTYLRDRRPDLPRPLVAVLERAIAPASEGRPQSAGEMDLALADAARAMERTDAPAGPGTEPGPLAAAMAAARPRAVRLRWIAGLVALPILGAGALALGLHGRYSVEATLYRSLPQGERIALGEKDAVAVNDQVFLELRGTKDLYVYVVNRDLSGDMTLLFPHPQLELQNPLTRKSAHRLPGRLAGADVDWKISTAGGKEQFLIITSPRRLADLEADIKDLDRPGYATVTAEALVRGVKEFSASPGIRNAPGATATEEIFGQARPLGHGPESARGAWIRKLELMSH